MKSSRTLAAYATIVILSSFPISSAGPAPLQHRETQIARSSTARFVDVTGDMGLPTEALPSWGSVFFDYNRDGRADLLLNRHTRRADLFVNHGTFFLRHQTTAFQEKPAGLWAYDRHDCAWGEANRDGRPDLYCLSGAQRGRGRGPNQLLIATKNDFVDRSSEYGVRYQKGRGRSVNWMDYNRDSRLDLFVGNDWRNGYPNRLYKHRRSSFSQASIGLSKVMETSSSLAWDWDRDRDPDLLVLSAESPTLAYRNNGSRFISVAFGGVTGRHWLSGAAGDYNGDGWTDLVLVRKERVVVWHNQRGTFRRGKSVHVKQGRAAAWLDLENDGDLDLFVVQGRRHGLNQPDFLLERRGGSFHRAAHRSYRGPRTGGGDSLSLADFNRDGRVDVLVTNSFKKIWAPITLLQNKTPAGHWLELELNAGRGNPFGFGARVRIKTSSRILWREMTDGVGFRGQSEGALHVGLRSATRARIKVIWPRGGKDCVSVRADGLVNIRRGAHGCKS